MNITTEIFYSIKTGFGAINESNDEPTTSHFTYLFKV